MDNNYALSGKSKLFQKPGIVLLDSFYVTFVCRIRKPCSEIILRLADVCLDAL